MRATFIRERHPDSPRNSEWTTRDSGNVPHVSREVMIFYFVSTDRLVTRACGRQQGTLPEHRMYRAEGVMHKLSQRIPTKILLNSLTYIEKNSLHLHIDTQHLWSSHRRQSNWARRQ